MQRGIFYENSSSRLSSDTGKRTERRTVYLRIIRAKTGIMFFVCSPVLPDLKKAIAWVIMIT